MIEDNRVQSFLEASQTALRGCLIRGENGIAFCASYPSQKYPFIYVRDYSVAIRTFCELRDLRNARLACNYLLALQSDSGEWIQRYDEQAKRCDEVLQEDTTPLALWALLSYVKLSNDSNFKRSIRSKILKSVDFIVDNSLHGHSYLARTTTSIHETEVNKGFELWNTCAHCKVLEMVGTIYGTESCRELASKAKNSILNLLTFNRRFIRRLDESGNPDFRVDINLMSPFYFGLFKCDHPCVENSVNAIESVLRNSEIGGYTRYITYSIDELSDFPGSWPHYSAWMAQYYYMAKKKEVGDEIIDWILKNSLNYLLPEIVTTQFSFKKFYNDRLRRSRSLRNELYRARDQQTIDKMAEEVEKGRKILHGTTPLLWAHIETLRALRMGGYINTIQFSL